MSPVSPGFAVALGVLASFLPVGVAFFLAVVRASDTQRPLLARLRAFRSGGLRTVGVTLAGAGLLSMLAAVVLSLLLRPEGRLASEGLFTLRAPHDLEVSRLTTCDEIDAGAEIAWFRSPTAEAAVASLRMRLRALEAEGKLVRDRPLELDPKLVERQREIEAEDRHLRAAEERLVTENRAVARERARSVLEKKQQILELAGRLGQLPRELVQARAELREAERRCRAAEDLHRGGMLSDEKHFELATEVEVRGAAVQKLEADEQSARAQEALAAAGLAEVEDLLAAQATGFERELDALRRARDELAQQRATLEEELRSDLVRANERRQADLERVRVATEQCGTEIAGLERRLTVTGSFPGRVVYRNPSPATVHGGDPLLVIAPEQAFHVRLRLLGAQARAASSAGALSLEVISPKVRKGQEDRQQPLHLVRRFRGRVASLQPIPDEPSLSLVKLACDPPEEAVRELALGEIVQVRLLWVPPPWTLPLLAFGLPLLLAGVVANVIAMRSRAGAPHGVVDRHLTQPANARIAEAVADAPALRSIGAQLGDDLRAASLDPSLIATAEWVLDRHATIGARFLGEGLAYDDRVRSGLDRLVARDSHHGSGRGRAQNGAQNGDRSAERRQEVVNRLLRVLDAIDSERPLVDRGASRKVDTEP